MYTGICLQAVRFSLCSCGNPMQFGIFTSDFLLSPYVRQASPSAVLCFKLTVLLVDVCTPLSVRSKYIKHFKLPADHVLGIALDVSVNLRKIGTFVLWRHPRMRCLSITPNNIDQGPRLSLGFSTGRTEILRYWFCYNDKWCLVYILLWFLWVTAALWAGIWSLPTFRGSPCTLQDLFLLFENFVGKVGVSVTNILGMLRLVVSEMIFT